MEKRPWFGALLFLCAMGAGAVLLLGGLVPVLPAVHGFAPPNRGLTSFYASPTGGRLSPEITVTARPQPGKPLVDTLEAAIAKAETSANTALDRNHWFIEAYGGYQALTGRTFLEDSDPKYSVVKLADGSLDFVSAQPLDVTAQATAVARLSQWLENRETPFLYLQAPQKLQADDDRLPDGVVDYGNAYADDLLSLLAGHQVDTIDLRQTLAQEGGSWGDWFFRTDHHWTPQAAFAANAALCDRLREDYDFDIPSRHTDPDYFRTVTYEDWFLGSQGKRVGTAYAGVDDITLMTPTYPTEFTYAIPYHDMVRTGAFDRSLLFPERLAEQDYFDGNPYTLYAGGDYPMATIVNETNLEGKRVVLLRDSFACALTPFLANACGELITIDLRYFTDNLQGYLTRLNPDLVLTLYTTGSVGLDPLFDFFKVPGAQPFYKTEYVTQPPLVARNIPAMWVSKYGDHVKS